MMKVTNPGITALKEIVESLPAAEKALFRRIYAVTTAVGELRTPPPMQPWVRQQFGSVEAVTRQQIVKVTNMITSEEALFNRLRSSRPVETKANRGINAQLAHASKNDLFKYPQDNTPKTSLAG